MGIAARRPLILRFLVGLALREKESANSYIQKKEAHSQTHS